VAAAEEPSSPQALYWGAEPGPDAAGRAAASLALLADPVALDHPPAHLHEVVPPGELTVLGAETASCEGDPVDAVTYRGWIDELYKASTELEDTSSIIERLRSAQPCLAEPIDRADMTRFSFLRGVIAFGDGDKEAATAAFDELLAIDPGYPWDPEYPPDVQLVFANAATRSAQAAKAAVRFAVPEETGLWMDGRAVDDREMEAGPGLHLVQVRGAGSDPFAGRMIHLAPAGEAIVIAPGGLEVTDADALPLELLGALAAATSADHLVLLGPEPRIWARDAETGGLVAVELTPAARTAALGKKPKKTRRSPPGAAPILTGVGAGMLVCGAIVAGVASTDMAEIRTGVEAGEIPYAHPDDDDPTPTQLANKADFDQSRIAAGVGVGLLITGGATLAISIPVGIAGKRKDRQVSLTARALARPPAPGQTFGPVDGFQLSLNIR